MSKSRDDRLFLFSCVVCYGKNPGSDKLYFKAGVRDLTHSKGARNKLPKKDAKPKSLKEKEVVAISPPSLPNGDACDDFVMPWQAAFASSMAMTQLTEQKEVVVTVDKFDDPLNDSE